MNLNRLQILDFFLKGAKFRKVRVSKILPFPVESYADIMPREPPVIWEIY